MWSEQTVSGTVIYSTPPNIKKLGEHWIRFLEYINTTRKKGEMDYGDSKEYSGQKTAG